MGTESKRTFPDKAVTCILAALTVVYAAACVWLYYHQIFFTEGQPFESDLPFHIQMAVEDNWFYSLTAILYKLFYLTPFGAGLTAVFLALVSVGTIYATYGLLKQMTEGRYLRSVLLFFAVLLNFIMPFFLRAAHFQRYIGYQSASIWHNSTYSCMKLAAVLVLLFFVKYEKKYRQGLTLKEWCVFALLLVICNAVKPSFAMVFAPAMAVLLLADLIKRVSFSKIFVFGAAVLPSLVVILWQNMVLFGQETGNGIAINPGYALSLRGDHPKVTFVLSIAFPLLVLLFNISSLWKDKMYGFSWLVWLFGFLEVFLFSEAGARAKDANFFWGYSIAIFFVNVTAVLKLLQNNREEEGVLKHKLLRSLFLGASVLAAAYQCYNGIYFFTQLLTGRSYWM